MSERRLHLGARPSSASALSTRLGVQWTPDFNAGAAELELETILNRFHLGYRTTAAVSAALSVIARPEDMRSPRWVWTALCIEAADTAYLWRRTRTWQTMQQPGVLSVDSLIGVIAIAIGTRAMRLEPQVDGTAWTNRVFNVRMALVPFWDRRTRDLLTFAGIQVAPHLLGDPPGGPGRVMRANAPALVSALVQGYVVGSRMRRKARIIDARALRWASEELAEALAAEEAVFHDEVLGPAPRVLRFVADNWVNDRPAALAAAAAEERRLRAWMSADTGPVADPVDHELQMAEVDAGIRRLGRRLEGAVRAASAVSDVVDITRRARRGGHRRPMLAVATRVAVATRGAAGVGLATDALTRRLGERPARRLVAVTDVLATAATAAYERAEESDRAVSARVNRFAFEVAATTGVARGDGPEFVVAHGVMAATRALAALCSRRPVPQRLAAAANAALIVWSTGRQVESVVGSSLSQAKALTTSTIEVARDRSELRDVRVQYRAFVHDGLAQLLAALRSGSLDDDREVKAWIVRERVRVEAAVGTVDLGHAGDLVEGLESLYAEFDRRGLYLLWETSELPAWFDDVAGTIVEIIREALNNVVRHAGCGSAWCGAVAEDDGTVVVRITDFATNFPVFRPGGGTGTATMIALARMIDAHIEWFQTPTGGTEVRVQLREPTSTPPADDRAG